MSKVGIIEYEKLVNGSKLMYQNTDLVSVECTFPALVNGQNMFDGCSSLQSFNSDLSQLVTGENCFNNTVLKTYKGNLGNLKNGYNMFNTKTLTVNSIKNISESISVINHLNRDNDDDWILSDGVIPYEKRGIITIRGGLRKNHTEWTNDDVKKVQNYIDDIIRKGWYIDINDGGTRREDNGHGENWVYANAHNIPFCHYGECDLNISVNGTKLFSGRLGLTFVRHQGWPLYNGRYIIGDLAYYPGCGCFIVKVVTGNTTINKMSYVEGYMTSDSNMITPKKGYFNISDSKTWQESQTYLDDGTCEGQFKIHMYSESENKNVYIVFKMEVIREKAQNSKLVLSVVNVYEAYGEKVTYTFKHIL